MLRYLLTLTLLPSPALHSADRKRSEGILSERHPRPFEGEEVQCPANTHVNHLNPDQKRSKSMQDVKPATVKVCQRITWEETQERKSGVGFTFQEVTDCR